jgi:hypothetical protein
MIKKSVDRVLGDQKKQFRLEKSEIGFKTKPIPIIKDLPKKVFGNIKNPIQTEFSVSISDQLLKEIGREEYCLHRYGKPVNPASEEKKSVLNALESKLNQVVSDNQEAFKKRLCDLVKSQKKNNGVLKVYGKNLAGIDLMAGISLDVQLKNLAATVDIEKVDIEFTETRGQRTEVPVEVEIQLSKINVTAEDVVVNEEMLREPNKGSVGYHQNEMKAAYEKTMALKAIKQSDVSASEWENIQIDIDTYTLEFYRHYSTKYCMENHDRDGGLTFKAQDFDIDINDLRFKVKAIADFDLENEGLKLKSIQLTDNLNADTIKDKLKFNFGSENFAINNVIFPTFAVIDGKINVTCHELENSSKHLNSIIDEELGKLPEKLSPVLAKLIDTKLVPKLKNKLNRLSVPIKSMFNFPIKSLKQDQKVNGLAQGAPYSPEFIAQQKQMHKHLLYVQGQIPVQELTEKEKIGAALLKYLKDASGSVRLDKVAVNGAQGLTVEADLELLENGKKTVNCLDALNNCSNFSSRVNQKQVEGAHAQVALNGKVLSTLINKLDQEIFAFFLGQTLVDEQGKPILTLSNYDLGIAPVGKNRLKLAMGINVNARKMNGLMRYLFGNTISKKLNWAKIKSKVCQSMVGKALRFLRVMSNKCAVDQDLVEEYESMQLTVPLEMELVVGKLENGVLPLSIVLPNQENLFESQLIKGNWDQYYLLNFVIKLLKGENMVFDALDYFDLSVPNLYEFALNKVIKKDLSFDGQSRPNIGLSANIDGLNTSLGIDVLDISTSRQGHIGISLKVEDENKLWKMLPELREIKL